MQKNFLCNLCPRKCNIDRKTDLGYCGEGNLLKLARASLHFWEEPCISGMRGSGTVFFSGCILKCRYCQNYKISHDDFGKEISISKLAEIFLNLQNQGALNINLVSPTHFSLQIAAALKMCRDKLKIPVIYNTGGYENVSTLRMMKKYVDIYLTDLKYFDNTLGEKYSGAADYFEIAMNAAEEMLRQKKLIFENGILKQGVVIRHLILPAHRKDSIEILKAIKKRFGTQSFILSLMSQYVPSGHLENFPEINRKITTFEYNSVVDAAIDLGFKYAYMQDKSSAVSDYTPCFDLTGMDGF